MMVSRLSEIVCYNRYRILDEGVVLLIQSNRLLTALFKSLITVLLCKVQNTQAHTIGLDFIWSGFEDCTNNSLCIPANELGFLDKVRSIPLGKSFIVARQMIRIC